MQDVPVGTETLGSELVACPNFRIGDQVIKTMSMTARFGTAREVTLDELRVVLVFPIDEEGETFFRSSGDQRQLRRVTFLSEAIRPARIVDVDQFRTLPRLSSTPKRV